MRGPMKSDDERRKGKRTTTCNELKEENGKKGQGKRKTNKNLKRKVEVNYGVIKGKSNIMI